MSKFFSIIKKIIPNVIWVLNKSFNHLILYPAILFFVALGLLMLTNTYTAEKAFLDTYDQFYKSVTANQVDYGNITIKTCSPIINNEPGTKQDRVSSKPIKCDAYERIVPIEIAAKQFNSTFNVLLVILILFANILYFPLCAFNIHTGYQASRNNYLK